MGDTCNDTFIKNVYRVAEEKGLKIGEVERAAGISSGYLSRIRKDTKASPSLSLAASVAKALGVSLDSLIEEVEADSDAKKVEGSDTVEVSAASLRDMRTAVESMQSALTAYQKTVDAFPLSAYAESFSALAASIAEYNKMSEAVASKLSPGVMSSISEAFAHSVPPEVMEGLIKTVVHALPKLDFSGLSEPLVGKMGAVVSKNIAIVAHDEREEDEDAASSDSESGE